MRACRRSTQEQLHLINECRTSGLTIADWCRREGIRPATYHTWVSRLSEKGLLEKPAVIPQPVIRDPYMPDIVKVEVTPPSKHIPKSLPCPIDEPEGEYALTNQMDYVMEITLGSIRIKVSNQINPQLLTETIQLLGG